MEKVKITKISMLNLHLMTPDSHQIIVNTSNIDRTRHQIILQVGTKKYNLEKNSLVVKNQQQPVITNAFQALLQGNNSLRVKAFIYDFVAQEIVEAKLQEFGLQAEQNNIEIADVTARLSNTVTSNSLMGYKPIDDLLSTVPVILGWEKPKVLEKLYKLREIDYVCVNIAYKHVVGTTYFDLDNTKIILNNNFRPYAFVGIGTPEHKGQLAMIENINTGQLFYPKSTDKDYTIDKKGYVGYDAYGILRIPFEGFTLSKNEGIKVYANKECEYFINDKSIGKFDSCRSCAGLPTVSSGVEKKEFTINKKTFQLPLPKDLIVTASDINEIKEGMPILINNDRSINRQDKEDQQFEKDKLPSKNAEDIYKEITTLWNNYEKPLYIAHLTPLPNVSPIPLPNPFEIEKSKLDNKKLLMPDLIKDGSLANITEEFIKTFFENKIKGFSNLPIGLKSLYTGKNAKTYEKAGSDLLSNFFSKTGKSYYKTKIIADAIYKTENGKETINNIIKLIDQVFQYQMSKPREKINNKEFLKEPLDNAWFDKGIDPETFPSFGVESLGKTDEDILSLLCIGGTQKVKIVVKNFTPVYDKTTIGYDATIILEYGDYFGVSESDYIKDLKYNSDVLNIVAYNYRGGVIAQWILQHQYGYQPFNDYLTYTVKMKRKWKK